MTVPNKVNDELTNYTGIPPAGISTVKLNDGSIVSASGVMYPGAYNIPGTTTTATAQNLCVYYGVIPKNTPPVLIKPLMFYRAHKTATVISAVAAALFLALILSVIFHEEKTA